MTNALILDDAHSSAVATTVSSQCDHHIVSNARRLKVQSCAAMVAGTWSVAKSARKRFFRKRRDRNNKQGNAEAITMSTSTRGGSGSSLALQENAVEEKSGWLNKWTNYIKGYRQRWFVLDSAGVLSYYRS
ncbi:hypothetical protein RB195_011820 [Necator americanus]|uniref:PH domain-containing protein n=1 Tax=Necator americanus TaxID=51031 RepID=A0ABR1D462_NECAM